jgi:thiol-disulfide isomerase/thioredoxin
VDWADLFAQGRSYSDMLALEATHAQRQRWDAVHARVSLSPAQRELLASFRRRMPVLVLNGAWCGDCISQCPIFDHFAQASPAIALRFIDRDLIPELRAAVSINAGQRVPVVIFLSEDFHEVSRYGDRTLSRYRQLAEQQLGPSCPTGLLNPADDILDQVAAEWLAEFERVQLLLRLSARLRQKHGD